MDEIDLNKYRK